MALSRNAFRSALEPLKGKLCLVLLHSPRVELILSLTLGEFSRDGLLTFSSSRPIGELLEVDFGAIAGDSETFEFGEIVPIPARFKEMFPRDFDKAASGSIDGELRVTLLFWKG